MADKTPNSEQKKAIEHTGGVLLSAGAGSGKTFVLVEHIIYLIGKFFNQKSSLDEEKLADELTDYLRSIVLMTFTKKAAGEMAVRLMQRLKQMQAECGHPWQLAFDRRMSININTIHSFCLKILKEGHFVGIDPQLEITSSIQIKEKIEILMNQWMHEKGLKKYPDLASIFLLDRARISNALLELFNDPLLRDSWVSFGAKSLNWKGWFEQFIEVLNIKDAIKCGHFEGDFSGGKKWQFFIQEASSLKIFEIKDLEDLIELKDFLFIKHKGLRRPKVGTQAIEVDLFFDAVAVFKENFKKAIVDIEEIIKKGDRFQRYNELYCDLINFIEENYYTLPGLGFCDLEYMVLRAMENEASLKSLSAQYRYFVIDEFQDTSKIQFQIVKKIIQSDYSRLFCIGDQKQAIYGFRGGELAVFNQLREEIPHYLTLANNYRSLDNIITFNNEFYEKIFKLGAGYSGTEQFKIKYEKQNSPQVFDKKIPIKKILINIDEKFNDEDKVSSGQMSLYESKAIVCRILDVLNEHPDDSICILYRELAPSRYLLGELLKSNLSFSAQVKIPYKEAPILAILNLLLEYKLDPGGLSQNYFSIMLGNILDFLGCERPNNIDSQIENFYKNWHLLGPAVSFKIFIYNLKLSCSLYENDLSIVTEIEKICGFNMDVFYSRLKSLFKNAFSFDFKYGARPDKIKVMSAHASKGLEFDHVIVGGIYTNERSRPNTEILGKFPSSFRWRSESKSKKQIRSPQFILDQLTESRKSFSESKRLLYVTTTRAHKSLSWVILESNKNLKFFKNKNSWVNAFMLFDHAIIEEQKVDLQILEKSNSQSIERLDTPLFHRNNLGVESVEKGPSKLVVTSELSVTKLTTLAMCPFKFYLKNIVKVEEKHESPFERQPFEQEGEILELVKKSSLERGIELHSLIERFIKFDERDVESEHREVFKWLTPQIDGLKDGHQLFSEVPIKFSFFNFMVSGTIDFLAVSSDKSSPLKIWDFKTGKRREKKEKEYWYQLQLYAYSQYLTRDWDKASSIQVSIVYLDERKIVNKTLDYVSIEQSLSELWKRIEFLAQKNLTHCDVCGYNFLCQKNTSQASGHNPMLH